MESGMSPTCVEFNERVGLLDRGLWPQTDRWPGRFRMSLCCRSQSGNSKGGLGRRKGWSLQWTSRHQCVRACLAKRCGKRKRRYTTPPGDILKNNTILRTWLGYRQDRKWVGMKGSGELSFSKHLRSGRASNQLTNKYEVNTCYGLSMTPKKDILES